MYPTTEERVKAENTVRKHTMAVWENLQPVLARFEGKKVLKADNSLRAAFKADLQKALPGAKGARVWFDSSFGYSLWANVDVCTDLANGVGCFYAKQELHLANIQNGFMIASTSKPRHLWPVSLPRVRKAMEKRKRLRDEVADLDSFLRFLDKH